METVLTNGASTNLDSRAVAVGDMDGDRHYDR